MDLSDASWDGKAQVQSEIWSHGHRHSNLLSRETTFLMGILKKCLSVEKAPNEPNNQISLTSVSGHSVPLMEESSLTPTEGVFCIHLRPRKMYLAIQFRPWKRIHLRPRKTDLRWIMPASPIWQNLQNLHQITLQAQITIHFLLQIYLLHRKRWNLHMQTYSKVLVNFQENLQAEIEARCSPSKTQTKKSSCTSPRCLPWRGWTTGKE